MDCFFGKTYAVSGEKLYFCGICEPGRADYFTKVYCDVLSKADFNGLKDDYYIDIKLYKIINKADSNGVFALGAGVVINDALHIGGGIIGNPNEDGESANDAVESIGNGLYCIAYGGRFGAVFECEKPQAVLISEKIAEYNKLDIKTAV